MAMPRDVTWPMQFFAYNLSGKHFNPMSCVVIRNQRSKIRRSIITTTAGCPFWKISKFECRVIKHARPGSHPPSSSVLHRTTSSYINASSSSTRSSPKLVPHTSDKSYPSQRFLWKRSGFGYEMQWLNHKGWGVIPGTRTCCWISVQEVQAGEEIRPV